MASYLSLGDLSSSLQIRQQTTRIKRDLQQGVSEISSGRVADPSRHLKGDFRSLAAFDRGIALAESRRSVLSEVQLHAEAMQSALGAVHTATETTALALLSDAPVATLQTLSVHGAAARQAFAATVAALNQQVAGRSLFAGAATDTAALVSAQTMLADLEALVAGETTAAGVIDLIDTWFDTPGGGFETSAYTGSTDRLSPMRIGDDTSVNLGLTASDPEIRVALKSLALGALLDGPTLGTDLAARQALAREAGTRGVAASPMITGLRAQVGSAEEQIVAAQTRNENEIAASRLAVEGLVGINPHDVATRLQATQQQLETLYALTARVQRLSLVDYMR